MSSPITRVAERLRNISQLSYQIARNERQDNDVVKLMPDQVRRIAALLQDAGQDLTRYAGELETYQGRRQEDSDALVVLAQTAINLSTVLGSDGSNLRILTHSDPDYIQSIFEEGDENMIEQGFGQVNDLKKKHSIVKRLAGKAGLDVKEFNSGQSV